MSFEAIVDDGRLTTDDGRRTLADGSSSPWAYGSGELKRQKKKEKKMIKNRKISSLYYEQNLISNQI